MLPSFFPAGTEFADVQGVPVSCTFNGVCRAWDRDPDRQFPIESLIYEGTIITEAEFRELNRIRQTSSGAACETRLNAAGVSTFVG
jgi:hypothetical protein